MRNPIFLIPLLTLIVFISGCTQMVDHIDNGEMEYFIPDPPDIYEPEPVFLSERIVLILEIFFFLIAFLTVFIAKG